ASGQLSGQVLDGHPELRLPQEVEQAVEHDLLQPGQQLTLGVAAKTVEVPAGPQVRFLHQAGGADAALELARQLPANDGRDVAAARFQDLSQRFPRAVAGGGESGRKGHGLFSPHGLYSPRHRNAGKRTPGLWVLAYRIADRMANKKRSDQPRGIRDASDR